jgi:hypothetical protein
VKLGKDKVILLLVAESEDLAIRLLPKTGLASVPMMNTPVAGAAGDDAIKTSQRNIRLAPGWLTMICVMLSLQAAC